MNCKRCSAEAWKCGTGSLHAGECIVCAVNRADEAEERVKELESKIEKAINYVDEYLVHGDEGLMNELKDAMMMEDES